MSKVPFRPTGHGDTTRGERSARREALLNVAAHRMGKESWSAVETVIREAVEHGSGTGIETDIDIQLALITALDFLLAETRIKLIGRSIDPPADVIEALKAHPRRRKNWTVEEILKREA